jgi:hypothetical protein
MIRSDVYVSVMPKDSQMTRYHWAFIPTLSLIIYFLNPCYRIRILIINPFEDLSTSHLKYLVYSPTLNDKYSLDVKNENANSEN